MAADDDRADVEQVLAGDVDAFERIVRRWQRPLVNLAYRFCRDPARAEEMAQEAFLRAWRALGAWRRDAAFSTWLFALAMNFYRSELRRIPADVAPTRSPAEPRDASNTEDTLETEDRARAVRDAVSAMPGKYREALILFYFHGMDVQETARTLALPEGTVKARLSRGREMLRRKLAGKLTTARLKEVS